MTATADATATATRPEADCVAAALAGAVVGEAPCSSAHVLTSRQECAKVNTRAEEKLAHQTHDDAKLQRMCAICLASEQKENAHCAVTSVDEVVKEPAAYESVAAAVARSASLVDVDCSW
jgi:hypothetical protein